MSANPNEQPPSYEEAMGGSPTGEAPTNSGMLPPMIPVPNEQPSIVEVNSSTAPDNTTQEEAEKKKKQKAEEAGWRSDLFQPAGEASGGGPIAPLSGGQAEGQDSACGTSAEALSLEERNRRKAEEAGWKAEMMVPAAGPSTGGPTAPLSGGQAEGQDSACGTSAEALSLEERNRRKAEEAGWKAEMNVPAAGPSTGPVKIMPAPLVLPPGLQPLLVLDTLFLRGLYERGKGRRYKITNKDGGAILYARSIHKGHHHPKDIQLYDSTRTAVVGQLVFSKAADNSMYANLECPSKVSLSTIRAEDIVAESHTANANPNQAGTLQNRVKYTICNIIGEAVFEVSAPTNTDSQEVQIKVYSMRAPGTPVADIWWNVKEETGGQVETQSTFGERDDASDERRVKITFPLCLEVKMKAAIVAMCMLKDKIDHRLEKRGSQVANAYRGASNQALGIAFGHHGRRRHHRF